MKHLFLSIWVGLLASTAAAFPVISDCEWQASARYLVEPWDEYSATFSNGATRIAIVETTEPATGSYGLLILSPPYSEMGERQCQQIFGFSALSLEGMSSAYDPSIGLQLSLTGMVYLESEGEFASAQVDIVINQETGAIDHYITPYFN